MKISGIYKIQSKIKPERIYIGSSIVISSRWKRHLYDLSKNKHRSSKLQRHYNKYGISDLQFSILLGCEKEDLIKIEQYFIDSYNPYFNSFKLAGSTLGFHHSEETKKKLSISKMGNKNGIGNKGSTGKKQSIDTITKRISKTKGMKRTEEFKIKSSDRQRGQKSINHFPKGYKTGKPAWNRGKPPSEEQKRKRRETMLKKKLL